MKRFLASLRPLIQQLPYRFPRAYDLLVHHGIFRWLGMTGSEQTALVAKALQHEGWAIEAPIGTGRLTIDLYAQRPNLQVVGIDLAMPMLQAAQAELANKGIINVHLICADMTALPFHADQFIQIVTLNGLQVVPHAETLIDELLRVAEDGCAIAGTATVDIGLEPRGGVQRWLVRSGMINKLNPEQLHEIISLTWSKLSANRRGAVYNFLRPRLDRATGEPIDIK
ncbi:class I SAM-dependent methyltransferase [Herpetosiphon gulosus]|uniref:2-methoxy-6-polyprenyl-1,4-benzoquinol methylase, mitochondrial n=1 Tax=Herpetosiphon gulosus TaxID=1973496 RepID=A0ABP9WVP5_9CHLR